MVEKSKKKRKGLISKAKKKAAVARAAIKKGKGIIRINKRNLSTFTPDFVQDLIREPLELAGPVSSEVDIEIAVNGGGFMGQAVASRAAIAKALLEFRPDEKLKKRFLSYDRLLLVDDVRRVESKKQLGPKARRKKQKSKR